MKNIIRLYDIFIVYLYVYVYYISCIFFFFLLYLFSSKVYIFNGDIYHGVSSYLLVMHSSLAITSSLFYYSLIFFFILLYLSNYNLSYYKYNIFYFLSLFIICHIITFILTGLIWSDYSWGFFLPIEYRIVKLIFILFFYLIYLLFNFYFKKELVNFNILIFFVLLLFFVFDFFFIDNLNSVLEVHQNDSSLHLFLIAISGSYMFTIFLFICYLFSFILNIILNLLFLDQYTYKKLKYIFYKKNIHQ